MLRDALLRRRLAPLALPALLLLLLLPATGCFRVTYRSSTRTPSAQKVSHGYDFFLLGLVGTAHVWPDRDCQGKGMARMASGVTAKDALLTIVTLGIYSPRSVVITCAQ